MKKISEKILNVLLIIWLSMMFYFLITKQYDEFIDNLIITFGSFILGIIYSKFKRK